MNTYFNDSELRRCRKLFLRNYEIFASIGAHAFEKNQKQRILLDIDIFVPAVLVDKSTDQLNEVVDYDFIRDVISERVRCGHINLQETLADDILRLMLKNPHVVAARVTTRKPDIYPDCEAVGVEVFGFSSTYR